MDYRKPLCGRLDPPVDSLRRAAESIDERSDRQQFRVADAGHQFMLANLRQSGGELPPESHQATALLRLPVIGKPVHHNRGGTAPLLIVAKSTMQIVQGHGQKATSLPCTRRSASPTLTASHRPSSIAAVREAQPCRISRATGRWPTPVLPQGRDQRWCHQPKPFCGSGVGQVARSKRASRSRTARAIRRPCLPPRRIMASSRSRDSNSSSPLQHGHAGSMGQGPSSTRRTSSAQIRRWNSAALAVRGRRGRWLVIRPGPAPLGGQPGNLRMCSRMNAVTWRRR